MEYRRLGRSGLLVSDLALGTMIFGEEKERATPPDVAERMIHQYLDAGGNHMDGANVYAGGRSEKIIGRALKGRRDSVVLATKVRFPSADGRSPGPNDQGLSRRHIVRAAEDSLRRLSTDYIDLYYMHAWDPLTPLEESLRAMDDLVTAGKVRYIGVSNFKAWQLMKALGISEQRGYVRFVAAQYQYSLVKRDIEHEFTELCREEGVGLTPWGPLGGGFLSGKYAPGDRPDDGRLATQPSSDEEAWERRNTERNWRILEVVTDIADARGVTVPQVALAWVRAQPGVASVLLGARTPDQLADNLGAATLNLTGEEQERLQAASALPERYPYRFLEAYAQRTPPQA